MAANRRSDTGEGERRRVVAVHDYSGHPFQVQLSRELARRGHEVIHLHCPSFSTPKGNLCTTRLDPAGLRIEPVRLRRAFAKYKGARRLCQEIEYGLRLSSRLRRDRPGVVLSSNTPLIAAAVLQLVMLASRIPVVFWQQDVYSVAMSNHVRKRLPAPVAGFVAAVLTWLERSVIRSSDAVVTISKDFVDILRSWGVADEDIHVVENWAPLDELPVRGRLNNWSARHGLDDARVLLYSGTLGLKHDPSLLLTLAETFEARGDVRMVVASEGPGADWLSQHGAHLSSLQVLGFQPYDDLPNMMASADVLVALLEPGASCYSVPSKVLTYHCAGRPILAALPDDNLAARIIESEGSGLVVAPSNHESFASAARKLVEDPDLCDLLGAAGRAYAVRTFDIERIGDVFEAIVERTCRAGR